MMDFEREANEQRDEGHKKAVEFARLYVATFVHHQSGKVLLEHWTKTLMQKRVAVDAPHTTYAAVEAVRAFIAGIHAEIEKAQNDVFG